MPTDSAWRRSDLSPLFRQRLVDIGDGLQLCVEIAGDDTNPPLLLIAGLGSQMTFWHDGFVRQLLERGFCVIRFDNRDTGLSSKITVQGLPKTRPLALLAKMQLGFSNHNAPVAYNLADMADDVIKLMDYLKRAFGFDAINLLGVSMGGVIAQIVAARRPSWVSTLILLFSTTNKPLSPLPYPKQFLTFLRRPASHLERDVIRHSVWFMTTVGSPGHLDIKGTRAIAKVRYQRSFYPLGVSQQLSAILATGSIVKYTKAISAPTLVLHGTHDKLLPISHGKYLAKTLPYATFVPIEGMGHDIPAYYHAHLAHLISTHYTRHSQSHNQ